MSPPFALGPRRRLLMVATVLFFGLNCVAASRLRLDERVTSFLPDSDPIVGDYRRVMERFRALDLLTIDVGGGPDTPRAAIVAVADALHQRLAASDFFSSFHYRADGARMSALMAALGAQRARLLGPEQLAELKRRLHPKAIRERLAALRRALIGPSGAFLRRRAARDPLGIDELVGGRLRSLSLESRQVDMSDGHIWSADGRHLLMISEANFPMVEVHRGRELVRLLQSARQEALTAAPNAGVHVAFAGGHIATLENTDAVKADVRRTLIAISIAIAVLGLLFFRRKLYVLLIFLPAAFGMSCAAALFGALGIELSGVAFGSAAALVSISVDYGVHVLFRIDQEQESHAESLRQLSRPLAMASTTSTAAFLCLLLSALPGQRQMGLLSAIGVLCSALFSLWILPAFIPSGAPWLRLPVLPLASLAGRFLDWRRRHSRACGALTLGLLALAGLGLCGLNYEGDFRRLGFLAPQTRANEAHIRETWQRHSPVYLVSRGPSREAALAAGEELARQLNELGAGAGAGEKRLVAASSTLTSILPSESSAAANVAAWEHFWGSRRAPLKAALGVAGKELGFSAQAFAPFFQELDQAPPRAGIPARLFAGTGIDALIHSRLVGGPDGWALLTTLRLAKGRRFDELRAALESRGSHSVMAYKPAFLRHVSALARQELQKLALLALFVMLGCLAAFLRRPALVLICALPVCASVLITLGLLGFFSIPINMVNSLFIVFVFGVGVDFTIFVVDASLKFKSSEAQGAGEQAATHGAVLICALTTVGGFTTMLFAQHPALSSVGVTGLSGILASLFAAAFIAPPLIDWARPKPEQADEA